MSISSAKKNIPIVVVFNILKNYYREYGSTIFAPIRDSLKEMGATCQLLPVVNLNYHSTIEDRANYIKQNLPSILEELKTKECHLLAYSVAGVDSRFYISELGGKSQVKSLTTISSPHLGSYLADSFIKRKILADEIEPITRVLGIPQEGFKELNTTNMSDFNASVHNAEGVTVLSNQAKFDVQYESVGARKERENCSDILRNVQSFIALNRTKGMKSDNDGVFALDETTWGKNRMIFNADHFELIGLRSNFDCKTIYKKIYQSIEH